MTIKLGTKNIVGGYIGSSRLCKIYKGSALYMDFCGGGEELWEGCDDGFDYNSYPPYSMLVSTNGTPMWPAYTYNDYSDYSGGVYADAAGGRKTFNIEANWDRHLITLTDYNTFPNGVEGLFKLFDNLGCVTEIIFVGEWPKPIKVLTMAFEGNPLEFLDLTQLTFDDDLWYNKCFYDNGDYTCKVTERQKEFIDTTNNHGDGLLSSWFSKYSNPNFIYCGQQYPDELYPPYSILYSTNGSNVYNDFKINGKDSGVRPQPNMTDELVTFDVGDGLTSLNRFCYSLTNLTSLKFVGKWDTSKVTDFLYFVSYNGSLETLEGIKDFDISAATDMGYCLVGNVTLKEVDISGWVFNENLSTYRIPTIQADKIYCSCDFKTALFSNTIAKTYNNDTYFENMITTPSECPLPEMENAIFYKANSTSNSNYFKVNGSNTLLRPTSETTGSYYIFGKKDFSSGYSKGLYQFAYNIKNLTYIEFLPTWNIGAATSAYYMFYGCSSLEDVKGLEIIDWTNITDLTSMFSYCENLKNIDLSPLSSCNEIINASMVFNSCKKITEADISYFNFSETATLTYMFSSCDALETVNLGELTPSSRNFEGMFNYCNSLRKIICTCEMKRYIEVLYKNLGLNSIDGIEFETIDGDDCPEYVPNNAIRYSTDNSTVSSNYGFYWNGSSSRTTYPSAGKTDEIYVFPNVKPKSMAKFVYFATNVTKFELFGNWDTSDVTNMRNLFYYVNNVTDLDLSKLNTRKATDMGSMFYANKLERLILGKDFSAESATNYSDMFYTVPNLKYIKCSCDFYKWCEEHKSDIGLADIWDNIEWDTDCEDDAPKQEYVIKFREEDLYDSGLEVISEPSLGRFDEFEPEVANKGCKPSGVEAVLYTPNRNMNTGQPFKISIGVHGFFDLDLSFSKITLKYHSLNNGCIYQGSDRSAHGVIKINGNTVLGRVLFDAKEDINEETFSFDPIDIGKTLEIEIEFECDASLGWFMGLESITLS